MNKKTCLYIAVAVGAVLASACVVVALAFVFFNLPSRITQILDTGGLPTPLLPTSQPATSEPDLPTDTPMPTSNPTDIPPIPDVTASPLPDTGPADGDQSGLSQAFVEIDRGECSPVTGSQLGADAVTALECTYSDQGIQALFMLLDSRASLDTFYDNIKAQNPNATEDTWYYTDEQVDIGRLLEYTDSAGEAVILWTIDQQNMVAVARRSDGNQDALNSWWAGEE
ncbi:MAG: hypothetical protein EHM70_04730 [Chloroflexota bacterium]|nr:MAG: hypothetical protein EHM70_04730 [Chloroflexota bacterium]